MTPRRAVAMTLGLALTAGLTVAVVQRQGSDGPRDVLSPASTGMLQPTAAAPSSAAPVVPVRATLSPAARRPRLPAWVHVDVPRVRVEPSCPDAQDAPEPSTRAVVPEQGDDENQDLLAEGGHAWLTFGDVDGRTRLVTLDLASGRSRSLDLAGATPEALGDAVLWASGWGGHGPALTRLPQGGHRVERTWDDGDLAGGRADHVAYSDGVVFLLRFDDDGSHLAGLDARSGELLWQRLLEPAQPDSDEPFGNKVLTADDGEAVVVVRPLRSDVRHVYRVGRDGAVLARAELAGPVLNMGPTVVANADGVYVGLRDELPGATNGFTHLLRLDRQTLALQRIAVLPGYVQLHVDGPRLLTDTVACDAFVVTRVDPRTLRTAAVYDLSLDSTSVHQVAFAAGRAVVAYKKRFEDDEVVVESYALT